uniref:Secreted protein n=1 Tax=Plectus sambesii TaxID=2011161 RepID=A0A914WJ71_9BILA
MPRPVVVLVVAAVRPSVALLADAISLGPSASRHSLTRLSPPPISRRQRRRAGARPTRADGRLARPAAGAGRPTMTANRRAGGPAGFTNTFRSGRVPAPHSAMGAAIASLLVGGGGGEPKLPPKLRRPVPPVPRPRLHDAHRRPVQHTRAQTTLQFIDGPTLRRRDRASDGIMRRDDETQFGGGQTRRAVDAHRPISTGGAPAKKPPRHTLLAANRPTHAPEKNSCLQASVGQSDTSRPRAVGRVSPIMRRQTE